MAQPRAQVRRRDITPNVVQESALAAVLRDLRRDFGRDLSRAVVGILVVVRVLSLLLCHVPPRRAASSCRLVVPIVPYSYSVGAMCSGPHTANGLSVRKGR